MAVGAHPAAEFVAKLLVACDAAIAQKSAGTLFAASRTAAAALAKYYGATKATEVTLAFTLEGIEVEQELISAPDQRALLHDLAYLFECTIVISDPGETGLAIFMRRIADEVSEPGFGDLDGIPGVTSGPPKRVATPEAAIEEKLGTVYPEVSRHEARTSPPPDGFSADEFSADPPTAPPPAGWTPELGAEKDPFGNF